MICYQDEKMYGPPADDMTLEELNNKIMTLELKLYGKSVSSNEPKSVKKPMIYDVNQEKLVERA